MDPLRSDAHCEEVMDGLHLLHARIVDLVSSELREPLEIDAGAFGDLPQRQGSAIREQQMSALEERRWKLFFRAMGKLIVHGARV